MMDLSPILKSLADSAEPSAELCEQLHQAIAAGHRSPEVLHALARLMTVSDVCEGSIEEIEALYEEAVALAPYSAFILVDFAYFQYAVLNKTSQAIPTFESACSIALRQLANALEGLARCYDELENATFVNVCLKSLRALADVDESVRAKVNALEGELRPEDGHRGGSAEARA